MKGKKLSLLLIMLLLAVGFAAVTTNLILNGNTKIGIGDFNVYFSEAFSESGDNVILSSDKKSITFETHTLNNIEDYSTMSFTVYNDSSDYSANVSFDYNISSNLSMEEILNYVDLGIESYDEENNYVPFNQGDSFILGAKEFKRFILYVQVHDLPLEDFSFTTNLTFNATPVSSDERYYNEAIGLYETMGYNNLEPGLYDTKLNMTKSWNQLIDENIIYVNDGVLSSNYNYDDEVYVNSVGKERGNIVEKTGLNVSSIASQLNGILGVGNAIYLDEPRTYRDFFDTHNTSCPNLNGILVVDESVESTVDYNFICSGLKGVIFKKADYLTYDKNYMGFANIKLFNIPIENVKTSFNSWGQYYVTANKVIDGDFVYNDAEKTSIAAYIGNSSNIVIPEGVTDIGPSAFAYDEIDSITFPSSYKVIGAYSLYAAIFDDLTIPSSIEELGDYAFQGAIYNTLTLSEGLKRIGNNIIGYVDDSSLTVPDSVDEIADYAFQDVDNVFINWSGEYPEDQWHATYINPYTQGDFLLGNVGSIILYKYNGNDTSITIPNEVKIIQSYAFSGNKDIKNVVIPSSVKTIRRGSFSGCTNIDNLTINSTLEEIGENAFGGVTNVVYSGDLINDSNKYGAYYLNGYAINKYVYTDNTLKEIMGYTGKYENASIPNGVERIKEGAFKRNYQIDYYTAISSITLPASVKYIEKQAFSGQELTNIDLPNGLLEIGERAFSYNRITNVTIPSSVTTIGNYAFNESGRIKTVINLPNTLPTSISDYAFSGNYIMYNGTETIPSKLWGAATVNPYIEGDFVYSTNDKTRLIGYLKDLSDYTDGYTLILPDGIIEISEGVFKGQTKIKKVIMSNTITTINRDVFSGCSNLEEIQLSSNLKYIWTEAFSGHNLKEVHIPDSLQHTFEAFCSSKANTKFYFPENSTWTYRDGTQFGEAITINSGILSDPETIGKWLTKNQCDQWYDRRS